MTTCAPHPATPHTSSHGCLLTLVLWLVWTGILGGVLTGVFIVNNRTILAGIGRASLPALMTMTEQSVTPETRREFSNAYLRVCDRVEHADYTDVISVLHMQSNLIHAIEDKTLTRGELDAYIAEVKNNEK